MYCAARSGRRCKWVGFFRFLAVLGILACECSVVYGGSAVVDGGFENADPTAPPDTTDYFTAGMSIDSGAWIVSQGTVGVDTQDSYVYDGNKSVFLDGSAATVFSPGPDSLTQTLTTVPGDIYTLDFFAAADTPNNFMVTFGGAVVTGAPTSIAPNGIPAGFAAYSGTAMATSISSDLVFTSTDLSLGTVEIDDVSVTDSSLFAASPEPPTWLSVLIGTAIGLIGMARSRREALSLIRSV